MNRSSRLVPARSPLPCSLDRQPLYPVTPAGRESVLTFLFNRIKEIRLLNVGVEVYHVPENRACYPCPLCGGVVFPSDDPGRDDDQEEGRSA